MPPLETLVTSWTPDIAALLLAAVVSFLYVRGVIRARATSVPWPALRSLFFGLGVALFLYLSCGFPGVYGSELRFVFTLKVAGLVFVVPMLLAAGRPLSLARAALSEGARRRVDAFFASRALRFLSHPVVSPLLGLALFASFLTPALLVLRADPVAGVLVTVIAPALGLLMVLPAVEGEERPASSGMMVVAFIYVLIELLADAIPGILLRLSNGVMDGASGPVAGAFGWFPGALRDQQLAGDWLWFVAETVDLPLIILLMIRFQKADRADAQRIDELSDEELDELNRQHLGR